MQCRGFWRRPSLLPLVGLALFASGLSPWFSSHARASTVERQDQLMVCRIDLREQHLRAFYTDQSGQRFGSIRAVARWLGETHEHFECATNGGIFAPDGKPLGWLVADGVELAPLNAVRNLPGNFYLQPNGALVIEAQSARLLTTSEVLAARALGQLQAPEFALQSGPLLLQGGAINARLDVHSVSRYARNAVCVVTPHEIILALRETPVSLYDFAASLQRLGCVDALYLDGHLSQMWPEVSGEGPLNSPVGPARQTLSVVIGVTAKDAM